MDNTPFKKYFEGTSFTCEEVEKKETFASTGGLHPGEDKVSIKHYKITEKKKTWISEIIEVHNCVPNFSGPIGDFFTKNQHVYARFVHWANVSYKPILTFEPETGLFAYLLHLAMYYVVDYNLGQLHNEEQGTHFAIIYAALEALGLKRFDPSTVVHAYSLHILGYFVPYILHIQKQSKTFEILVLHTEFENGKHIQSSPAAENRKAAGGKLKETLESDFQFINRQEEEKEDLVTPSVMANVFAPTKTKLDCATSYFEQTVEIEKIFKSSMGKKVDLTKLAQGKKCILLGKSDENLQTICQFDATKMDTFKKAVSLTMEERPTFVKTIEDLWDEVRKLEKEPEDKKEAKKSKKSAPKEAENEQKDDGKEKGDEKQKDGKGKKEEEKKSDK